LWDSGKSIDDVCLRLTSKISAKRWAELLDAANFTKRVGNLSTERLRHLVAEMRECRRKNEIRFNATKLRSFFEDDKT
jgi:hypothetical protein